MAFGHLKGSHGLHQNVERAHISPALTELLEHIDYLDEAMARLDAEVADQTRPFEAKLARPDSIPGVNRRIAEVLAAEAGVDMKPFADAEHLASWGKAQSKQGGAQHQGKRAPMAFQILQANGFDVQTVFLDEAIEVLNMGPKQPIAINDLGLDDVMH